MLKDVKGSTNNRKEIDFTYLVAFTHFATDPENLMITATDLEVGLQMSYNYVLKEPGSLTIPREKSTRSSENWPQDKSAYKAPSRRGLRSPRERSKFELAGMDASDYPVWISFDEIETFSCLL